MVFTRNLFKKNSKKNLKIKFPVKKLIISKKDKKLNTFDEFLRKIKSL